MLQQEAMGKDLRKLADHKLLKNRTNLILDSNQKYIVSRAMELSIYLLTLHSAERSLTLIKDEQWMNQ